MSGNLATHLLDCLTQTTSAWMYRFQERLEQNARKSVTDIKAGVLKEELNAQLKDKLPTNAEAIYAALEFIVDKKPNTSVAHPHYLRALSQIRQLRPEAKQEIESYYQKSKAGDSPYRHKDLYLLALSSAALSDLTEQLPGMMEHNLFEFVAHPQKTDENPLDKNTVQFMYEMLIHLEGVFYRLHLLYLGSPCAKNKGQNIKKCHTYNGDMLEQILQNDDGENKYFAEHMRRLLDKYKFKIIPHDVQMQTMFHFAHYWHKEILVPRIAAHVTDPDDNQAKLKRDALLKAFHRQMRLNNSPSAFLFCGTNLLHGHYLADSSSDVANHADLPADAKDFFNIMLHPHDASAIKTLNIHFDNAIKAIRADKRIAKKTPFLDISNPLLGHLSNGMLTSSLPDYMKPYQAMIDHVFAKAYKTELRLWQKNLLANIPDIASLNSEQKRDIMILSLQQMAFSQIKAFAKVARIINGVDWWVENVKEKKPAYKLQVPLHVKLMALNAHNFVSEEVSYKAYPTVKTIVSSCVFDETARHIPTLKDTLDFVKRRKLIAHSELKRKTRQSKQTTYLEINLPKEMSESPSVNSLRVNFHLAYANLEAHHDIMPKKQSTNFLISMININDQLFVAQSALKKHVKGKRKQLYEQDKKDALAMMDELTQNLRIHCDRFIDYLSTKSIILDAEDNLSICPQFITSLWNTYISTPVPIETALEKIKRVKTVLNEAQPFSVEAVSAALVELRALGFDKYALDSLLAIEDSMILMSTMQKTMNALIKIEPNSPVGKHVRLRRKNSGVLFEAPPVVVKPIQPLPKTCAQELLEKEETQTDNLQDCSAAVRANGGGFG